MSKIHHLFDLISKRPQQKAMPFNGFYPVHSELELLEPHRELVDKIRQYFGVPEAAWASTHEQLLHNFARRVQLLPDSEAHHHTELGGLLRHALERVNHAMKIRRGYMLPNGASTECISEQQEIWSFAVLCTALLHDIGKSITDVVITMQDEKGSESQWLLACGDIPAGACYRPEFCQEQRDKHHQSVQLLVTGQIIPNTALQWLSRYPEVFNLWLLTLSGRYAEAGMLGEIITRADQYATGKSPGSENQEAEDTRPPSPISKTTPSQIDLQPSIQPVVTSRRAKAKQTGQQFLHWLRQQIIDEKISINTINAPLHTVDEGLLLVSPAIFRRYLRNVDHLELNEIQRGFQSLGIHRVTASKKNIWTYRLQGEKRGHKLNGMLISDPLTVLELNTLPEANPLLMAETPSAGINNNSGTPPDNTF